ncbi:hypothetical protein D1007_53214 [Hordeum vulgare]|nr:hypothetical protein D1007_53214 [Hordeum vulgare]
MFLMWGWKTFARSRGIGRGYLLHFRLDGSTTLFMKFFGVSGVRQDCFAKSSSGSNIDTSNDSGDGSIISSVKQEGDKSK